MFMGLMSSRKFLPGFCCVIISSRNSTYQVLAASRHKNETWGTLPIQLYKTVGDLMRLKGSPIQSILNENISTQNNDVQNNQISFPAYHFWFV